MMSKARKVLEDWSLGRKLEGDALDSLAQEFEAFLDAELDAVEASARAGKGDEALQRIVRLNAFVSSAAVKRPTLMSAAGAKASRWRDIISLIAKALGAVEFTISFGIPSGISASLTFKVI